MAPHNDEVNRKIVSAQASITSLSIFIALSVAIIGLMLASTTDRTLEFTYNAIVVSSGCFMTAIVLFLVALEFFILCIYHCEHIDWFGVTASCLYLMGAICMVIGISVSFISFGIRELSFMFLTLAFLGYLAYYALRIWRLERENYFGTRMAFRLIFLLLMATGYALISTVGG